MYVLKTRMSHGIKAEIKIFIERLWKIFSTFLAEAMVVWRLLKIRGVGLFLLYSTYFFLNF